MVHRADAPPPCRTLPVAVRARRRAGLRRPLGLAQQRLPAAGRHVPEGRQRPHRLRLRLAHAVDVDGREARRGKRGRVGRRAGAHGRTGERRHRHGLPSGVQRLAQQAAVQPRVRLVDVLGRARQRAGRARIHADAGRPQRHLQRLAVSRGAAARVAALRQVTSCTAPTYRRWAASTTAASCTSSARSSARRSERPRHRWRRPRACAGMEDRAVAARGEGVRRARAMPARRGNPI